SYYRGTFDMGFGGQWSTASSSRPVGSALRDLVTYISGYSFSISLIVQAILLSIACYAATLSVAYWIGIWSGLAFLGFSLVMIKPFLATTGSEPLSLIWAFLSIACLAHACRTGAIQSAVFSLGLLCMAEFTRMGAVLVLGAIALWVLALPKSSSGHFTRKIVLVFAAVATPAILGSFLSSSYAVGAGYSPLGGVNFGGWNLGILACKIAAQIGWEECVSQVTS